MKIEFLMKWAVDMTPEEREEFRHEQMARGFDDEMLVPKKYVYREVALDINNSLNFNRVDTGHTAIRTKSDYFILKIPYKQFKAIYEISTGDMVKSHKDFRFSEPGDVDFEGSSEDDLIL